MDNKSNKTSAPSTLNQNQGSSSSGGDAIEWAEWTVRKAFEFPTTATIRCRESVKMFHTTTEYDPYHGWGDDDDIFTKEHDYKKIHFSVTPTIGLRSGTDCQWVFHAPGKLTYEHGTTEDQSMKKIWIRSDDMPTEESMINKLLPSVHAIEYEDGVLSLSAEQLSYLNVPLILNNVKFSELLEVPQNVSNVILELLGVTPLTLQFVPDHIFGSSLTINIIEGMDVLEIECLIITNLAIKYKQQNIKKFPKFGWFTPLGHRKQYDEDRESLSILTFDGNHDFGFNHQSSYVTLNAVGVGFKTLFFESIENLKAVTLQQLIDAFFEFSGIDQSHHQDLVYIVPRTFNKKKEKMFVNAFAANTRQRDVARGKVWPNEQTEKYITFNEEKYKEVLDKTLSELKLDINGSVFEMYHVAGPCISVCFASMVGDTRVMDVNFYWSLDTFKMYATNFGHGPRFHIQDRVQEKTLGEFCMKRKNSVRNTVVCRY